jgi:hypothetical protein
VPLDVDVQVVRDVEDHLHDPPARELERRPVLRADGVAAVVADAEPLAAEALARRDGPDLQLPHHLLVDVEPQRPDRLVMVAGALLREVDADDVRSRGRCVGDDDLLGSATGSPASAPDFIRVKWENRGCPPAGALRWSRSCRSA